MGRLPTNTLPIKTKPANPSADSAWRLALDDVSAAKGCAATRNHFVASMERRIVERIQT
jgi:hypothetical protein